MIVKIEIRRATMREHDTLLRNVYQFYLYEYSTFMTDWRVLAGGRFYETDLDGIWTDKGRHVFLIYADDDLAGFAFIEEVAKSYLTGEAQIIFMEEFYILSYFQKQGVGEKAAGLLFDHFPGKWEVSELPQNVRAQAFWRKVIGRYTNDNFREITIPEKDYVVQMFDNR